jgi:hypothetical protein
MPSASVPSCQVRACFSEWTIRVYQAYSPEIAAKAVAAQTFKPPFKRERMTWIKPSFTWMMYRSGWGAKPGQERILAIDILRSGWEWALANSCISHFESSMHASKDEWKRLLGEAPVRIQWDPERTISLEAMPWRTIQVGLKGNAVDAYADEWISKIEDVTALAREIGELVARGDVGGADALRPVELPYPLPKEIADSIRDGCRASPAASGNARFG